MSKPLATLPRLTSIADASVVNAQPKNGSAQIRLRTIIGLSVAALLCFAIVAYAEIPQQARVALCVFLLATAAWACTRLPETAIALCAACALVMFGVIDAEALFSGLGEDVIWLLIGAFLIASVLRASGLAETLALRAVASCGTAAALFRRLTWLIAATAFIVPSTSGRAALLLPVFLALAAAIPQPRIVRALALLFPTAILLSACASLLGAGAHLIAVDFMAEMGLRELDFIDWALLGAPFAAASSLIACETILRLFLREEERRSLLTLPAPASNTLGSRQWTILAMLCAIVALWATGPLHGLDPALLAVLGAIAMANRRIGGISLKDAMKHVEWNLIMFLAATLVLGEALLDSGAADWLARGALQALPPAFFAHGEFAVIAAAVLSMLAHLFVVSRSARAAVLIPTLAIPLAIAPSHAALLIVVATVGSGFCQSFRVSAKPVALFAECDGQPRYEDADLLRLSLWLMAPFALLLIAFALWLWPALGLGLTAR